MKLQHDGTIDLASGRNRKETNWKNREWQWSDLVKKLSTTHRTAETYSEYITSKKSRQDEIKDIGGFVGGYLNGGRRKAGNVVHRQLITLDIDFGHPSLWDDFTLLYGNAAVVYSTHKHTPEQPRLRLIMPLDRPVMADEYQAIARRIAGNIGIDYFDHTTFEPSRLMYWPSTASDAEFVFDYQDGEWISADELLGSYRDWSDASEWPMSDREGAAIKKGIQKQGDPLEKPGIVGAFCRTFTVHEAIEKFLEGIYDSCDVEDRYTYKEGSTAAGLVIYEDKYAYSHHGTDPCSGKLCNAFDLVRIHKYGLKDEDVAEGTPINKLPSYTAMQEFASTLPDVRKLIGVEKLEAAKGDFSNIDMLEDDEPTNNDWLGEMEADQKGNFYSTTNNVILVLQNDPMMKGRFAMDLFEKREVALRDLPWRKVTPNTRYLTDTDDAGIRHYLEATYGITGVQKIKDAMDMVVLKNAFHPVRDYLDELVWDGEKRVDSLLVDYLGAEDNEYTHAVIRKTLCAAVTRIYQPGAKFDYVTVLVGEQGKAKSSLIDRLGGRWFSDSMGTVQGKEAFEALQGVWLIELAELAQLKKAEVEQVKHFISKREDRYRVAYGRRVENFPRQCVFFGTSNNKDFLRDATGNRRFWPVDIYATQPVKNVFQHLTEQEVGQIWAEAVCLYKAGEKLYLTPELEKKAQEAQREHSEVDERAGLIIAYLEKPLPDKWSEMDVFERRAYVKGEGDFATLIDQEDSMVVTAKQRDRVCVAEIWEECFGGTRKDMSAYNTRFIHDVLRALPHWKESKTKARFPGYGVQKGYFRVS